MAGCGGAEGGEQGVEEGFGELSTAVVDVGAGCQARKVGIAFGSAKVGVQVVWPATWMPGQPVEFSALASSPQCGQPGGDGLGLGLG